MKYPLLKSPIAVSKKDWKLRFKKAVCRILNLVTTSCFNVQSILHLQFLNAFFLYLFLSFFPFVCVLLFVAVVVVVVVVVLIVVMFFLPIFTGCIQEAGKGTSPFCHSCT